MQPRLSHEDFTKAAPDAYAGLTVPGRAVDGSSREKSLTDLSPRGASNKADAALPDPFSESEAIFLSVAIAAIVDWNPLGVALRLAPPPPRALGA